MLSLHRPPFSQTGTYSGITQYAFAVDMNPVHPFSQIGMYSDITSVRCPNIPQHVSPTHRHLRFH